MMKRWEWSGLDWRLCEEQRIEIERLEFAIGVVRSLASRQVPRCHLDHSKR